MMVSLYKMGVQFPEGELSRAVGFHIQPWGGDTKTEPTNLGLFFFLRCMPSALQWSEGRLMGVPGKQWKSRDFVVPTVPLIYL